MADDSNRNERDALIALKHKMRDMLREGVDHGAIKVFNPFMPNGGEQPKGKDMPDEMLDGLLDSMLADDRVADSLIACAKSRRPNLAVAAGTDKTEVIEYELVNKLEERFEEWQEWVEYAEDIKVGDFVTPRKGSVVDETYKVPVPGTLCVVLDRREGYHPCMACSTHGLEIYGNNEDILIGFYKDDGVFLRRYMPSVAFEKVEVDGIPDDEDEVVTTDGAEESVKENDNE